MSIDDSQFGFVPRGGSTEYRCNLCGPAAQMEKYLAVNKRLYMAFVDLEKAFDMSLGRLSGGPSES